MNKILLFFCLILFNFQIVNAQKWSVYDGQLLHYSKKDYHQIGYNFNYSNSLGLSLLVDSIYTDSISQLIVFKGDYSDSEYLSSFRLSNDCMSSTASVFGDSLLLSGDSAVFYTSAEQLIWKSKDSSWLMYSDTANNQLHVQLDSIVSKGNDSLAYYSLNVLADSLHYLHTFDTAVIILSKDNGFIQFFDLSNFPQLYEPMKIIKTGPLNYGDIYNYEIGDEFHYVVSSKYNNQYSYWSYKKIIWDKKQISTDSVLYKINNNWYAYDLSTPLGTGAFLDSGLMVGFDDSVGVYTDMYERHAYLDLKAMLMFYNKELCNIFFENAQYDEYIFGIGKFHHSFSADGMSSSPDYYDEELVYYKKSGKTWGKALTTAITDNSLLGEAFQLSPNPAMDKINVNGLKSDAQFVIYNLNGKEMLRGKLHPNSNSININSFIKGLYFLMINSEKAAVSKKFLVQ